MIAVMLAPSGSSAASAVTSVRGGSFRGLTFDASTRVERYGPVVALFCAAAHREPIEALVAGNAGWTMLYSDYCDSMASYGAVHVLFAAGYLLGKAGA